MYSAADANQYEVARDHLPRPRANRQSLLVLYRIDPQTEFIPADDDYALKASRSYVQGIAEQWAESCGTAERPENVARIVRTLGGSIHPVSRSDYETLGEMLVVRKSEFHVFLPDPVLPMQANFAIAHALGHYLLHSDIGRKRINVLASRGSCPMLEAEANTFAMALLMPEKQLRESAAAVSLGSQRSFWSSLSSRYFVPTEYVAAWGGALGIAPHGQGSL